MASSPSAQPSALGIVILAWLSTRRKGTGTRADLRRAILTFLSQGDTAAEHAARLERALEALASASLVTRSPRGTVTLTTSGREAVARSLDLAESTAPVRWRTLEPHLLACALDLRGASGAATLSTPSGLRLAVLRRWVNEGTPTAPSAPSPEPPPPAENLSAFASRVIAAARASKTGRYGHNKVFISHVLRGLDGEPDPARFKERLVAAHREGLLDLSRADLVEAMSPEDVAASETTYFGATFHFVRMDAPGPASRRSAP